MNFLLDTNIVSETIKKNPNENVVGWLNSIPDENLSISVITLGELRKGVEKLQDNMRKIELINWIDHKLRPWFGGNIISINTEIAEKWGYISATTNTPAIDGLIAATCLTRNLTLVTRNIKDFNIPGLEVFNPF